MTAIKYIAQVPRFEGAKRRILVDAQYANDGRPINETWAEVHDPGLIDGDALTSVLGDAIWVGEGSAWRLPDAWRAGGEFWATGERSFDGSSPIEINKALAFTIANDLPWYPSAQTIREWLAGKTLAIDGARGDVTHADVLVAVAAGRVWRP